MWLEDATGRKTDIPFKFENSRYRGLIISLNIMSSAVMVGQRTQLPTVRISSLIWPITFLGRTRTAQISMRSELNVQADPETPPPRKIALEGQMRQQMGSGPTYLDAGFARAKRQAVLWMRVWSISEMRFSAWSEDVGTVPAF